MLCQQQTRVRCFESLCGMLAVYLLATTEINGCAYFHCIFLLLGTAFSGDRTLDFIPHPVLSLVTTLAVSRRAVVALEGLG
eukprot:878924-Rhodomonas_salina.3